MMCVIHPAVLGQLTASSFCQLLAKIEALPSLFTAVAVVIVK